MKSQFHLSFYRFIFEGMDMLKIAIASFFTKNKKYSVNEKIQGSGGYDLDGRLFFTA